MKLKKTKYAIALVLLGSLIWYLLIKQHDYIVTFKADTSPGTLFKGLEEWNEISQNTDSFNYVLNNKKPFESFDETVEANNLTLQLDWDIEAINDTISEVKVGFTEKGHSIYNRLTAPFMKTPFKEKSINLIRDYKKGIDYQLKEKFKVKISGIDTIPKLSYAYIDLKHIKMEDKAKEMMKNNSFLVEFLNKHNLKKGEFPFVIVDNWDLNNDQIDFRYCFPIVDKDPLPFNEEIKYDKIKKSGHALKAIYNGNYKTSDRAWFGLYEYAKRHDININNQPVEFFQSNPFYGGDELKWVTEIYMPLNE
jgi:effector-binding domain-containing protein